MDIAEIRKKAREEKSAATESGNSASPDVASDLPRPYSEPTADLLMDGFPTGSAEVLADESIEDGLDKLFSAELSLELVSADNAVTKVLSEELLHQYLSFRLGREEYALDIRSISEIIKVPEFTDVPRAPDFVLGIISLRGVVVPVYDLMARLQLGQTVLTSSSRIVVCQDDELTVGLLVDSISQVIKLADDCIEPPPPVLTGLDRDMMKGVGRYQRRMIVLLNVANVLKVDLT